MRRLLRRLLQIRRDESGLMLLSVGFAFGSVALTVVIRVFSDAVLLTSFDASYLPGFFAGSAAAFMVSSLAYATWLHRVDSATLNTWLLALLAAFSVVARLVGEPLGAPFIFALCLILTVAAPLIRIACWNAITECFDTRQAKRLLPLAGAGSTVGAIVAGLLAVPFVQALGTDDLLFVIAFLFAAMAPIPRLLARRAVTSGGPGVHRRLPVPVAGQSALRRTLSGLADMRGNRLAATVGWMLLLGAMATVFLDYSLKTSLQERFSRDEMAVFLGQFHALVNGLILVVQLFLVGRVLVGYGVRVVFSILPVVLLAGAGVMAVEPLFAVIVALNFLDFLLRYTFQNAVTEMVLTPVPRLERNRAKVVMKGVMVPLGGLVAGLLLLPLRELWPELESAWRMVGWVTVGIVAIWLYQVMRIRSYYLDQLHHALGFGQVVLGASPDVQALLERDAIKVLVARLERDEPEGMRFALDLLASGLKQLPEARRILNHSSPRVRIAALRAIARHRLAGQRREVLELLERDTDPEALQAGLAALRCVKGRLPPALAERLVEHTELPVRAEALALVHQHSGGRDPRPRSAVERWVRGEPRERSMAAYLLGEMSAEQQPDIELGDDPSDYEVVEVEATEPAPWDLAALGELLSDRAEAVRVAAYTAVGHARVRVYLPRLVQALTGDEEAKPAARALRDFGEVAVPALVDAARGRVAPRRLRARAIAVLGTIPVTASVFALLELVKQEDIQVRRLVIRALLRLQPVVTPRAFVAEPLLTALLREVRLSHLYYGLTREAEAEALDEFFVSEVRRRLLASTERIFELLGLLYDVKVMRALHRRHRHGDPGVRANTLELLENTVASELKGPLARLFEDAPMTERITRARMAWSLSEQGSFTVTLLDGTEDRWLQRCLLYVSRPELLRRYPSHRREVEEMVPLLERVILLKSVPLFGELSGETLYPIAEIAETVQVSRGTVIFEEGDAGNYLYVVVRGEVQIRKDGEPVATRKSGEAFGEMALLDDRPRSAAALARQDVEVLRIASEPFSDLLDQHPEISRGIIRVLLSYVRGEGGPSPV